VNRENLGLCHDYSTINIVLSINVISIISIITARVQKYTFDVGLKRRKIDAFLLLKFIIVKNIGVLPLSYTQTSLAAVYEYTRFDCFITLLS